MPHRSELATRLCALPSIRENGVAFGELLAGTCRNPIFNAALVPSAGDHSKRQSSPVLWLSRASTFCLGALVGARNSNREEIHDSHIYDRCGVRRSRYSLAESFRTGPVRHGPLGPSYASVGGCRN